MLFRRQWYDKLVICAFALGLFLYASYRPQFRLREQMPQEFAATTSSSHDQKEGSEQRIAQEYWNCAVKEIQWRYTYGSQLPQDPPPEYTITSAGVQPGTGDRDARIRYWKRLRLVWTLPSAWDKTYMWTLGWLPEWAKVPGRRLQERVTKVLNAP
jgi:hypothetical protein